jgi:hypothetical protein
MSDHPFDSLARTLADGTSRRGVFRALGGVMLGSLVAASPRAVLAQTSSGNSACAHFCAAVFGADTPAASQCTSDAAHGKGLCYTCGPASTGGTKSICCPKNGAGQCSSYSVATCCTSGQTCSGDQCICGEGCFSITTTEGGSICVCRAGTSCQSCTASVQCGPGEVCGTNVGCGSGGFCTTFTLCGGCPGPPTRAGAPRPQF